MEQKLKQLGFRKVHPDAVDKKYFYWQKNFKHPFLKGLHIIVDERVNVYCLEAQTKTQNDINIYSGGRNEYNLLAVIKWLKCQ